MNFQQRVVESRRDADAMAQVMLEPPAAQLPREIWYPGHSEWVDYKREQVLAGTALGLVGYAEGQPVSATAGHFNPITKIFEIDHIKNLLPGYGIGTLTLRSLERLALARHPATCAFEGNTKLAPGNVILALGCRTLQAGASTLAPTRRLASSRLSVSTFDSRDSVYFSYA